MKLSALLITNFKGIGAETKILIDNIVVLIGQNNSCKSTVLDAYEKYFSMGSALSIEYFHNRNDKSPITITGVFTELTEEGIRGQTLVSPSQSSNLALNPVRFAFWTLRDKAAQRRLALH